MRGVAAPAAFTIRVTTFRIACDRQLPSTYWDLVTFTS